MTSVARSASNDGMSIAVSQIAAFTGIIFRILLNSFYWSGKLVRVSVPDN